MTLHELKLNSRFFDAVLNKIKTFEVRKDDRGFRVGDTLMLSEVDDSGRYIKKLDNALTAYKRSDRIIVAKVTYVLTSEDFPEAIREGYAILGIEVSCDEWDWNGRKARE